MWGAFKIDVIMNVSLHLKNRVSNMVYTFRVNTDKIYESTYYVVFVVFILFAFTFLVNPAVFLLLAFLIKLLSLKKKSCICGNLFNLFCTTFHSILFCIENSL